MNNLQESDITGRDEKGFTLLFHAAWNGHRDVVELLIARGGQVDAVDQNGGIALHWAARGGHREVAELLLDSGAQVDAVVQGGWIALHWAACGGHGDVVELLLGGLKLSPSYESITESYNRVWTVLCCIRFGGKSGSRILPKDAVGHLLTLTELRRDLAVMFLKKLEGGSRIDLTHFSAGRAVLECAAHIVLEQNKALLDDVYEMLANNAVLKSFFAPENRERNFLPVVHNALDRKMRKVVQEVGEN